MVVRASIDLSTELLAFSSILWITTDVFCSDDVGFVFYFKKLKQLLFWIFQQAEHRPDQRRSGIGSSHHAPLYAWLFVCTCYGNALQSYGSYHDQERAQKVAITQKFCVRKTCDVWADLHLFSNHKGGWRWGRWVATCDSFANQHYTKNGVCIWYSDCTFLDTGIHFKIQKDANST